MHTYLTLLLYALFAEGVRRCVLVLLRGLTGPLSKIPGPVLAKFTTVPWIFEVIRGNQMNVGPELFRKYGDVVRVGPADILFADKASILKILVEDDFRKSRDYESVREDPHVSTLISEVDKDKYRRMRRQLSPGFSIAYLNGLEPLMHECLEVFTKVLDAKCEADHGFAIVDMNRILGNLTSDVMSATSFGGSFGLVESDDAHQKGLLSAYLRRLAVDAQFPFYKHLPGVSSPYAEIKDLIHEITTKRRDEMEKGIIKKDLLQIFMDTHKADPVGFSEQHLRDEMILFMIAGSDTTSLTATFTILLLLNNPDKMQTLRNELDAEFIAANKKMTFASTQDLAYLNAVINESMRVMPIITGGLVRLNTTPTTIHGYEIPSETITSAYVSEMHCDARIWPDAHAFIPERWLGAYKGIEADRKAFMPFSAGTRNCPGQQFALKELRLILVTVLTRYELSVVPGQSHELRVHTVPWFKQGFYNVGVRRRVG